MVLLTTHNVAATSCLRASSTHSFIQWVWTALPEFGSSEVPGIIQSPVERPWNTFPVFHLHVYLLFVQTCSALLVLQQLPEHGLHKPGGCLTETEIWDWRMWYRSCSPFGISDFIKKSFSCCWRYVFHTFLPLSLSFFQIKAEGGAVLRPRVFDSGCR